MLSGRNIVQYALDAGFSLCGVARARVLTEYSERFAAGLAASGDGALAYLVRDPQRRLDPSQLMPEARTVVICAVNYRNFRSAGYPYGFAAPKICSYALGGEYQPKIKAMLDGVLSRLRDENPGLRGMAFCDTSAILEKAWAVEAGLGWTGRNSLLVNPDFGSFLLLGGLVLDDECDLYDEPYPGHGCGECRRCVEGCPAGALVQGASGVGRVDVRRCISALTIERVKEPAPPERLHGWIYGCDECQSVCPYNKARPEYTNPLFTPVFDPLDFPAERWRRMSRTEFEKLFSGTPLTRTGLDRIKKMLPA